MEQEIRLLCSGYGAETGSDLLAVKLFENTETGEVHTEVTGGTGRETVRPLVCCMEASCIQLRNWSEKNTLTFISTAFRKMGFLSRPAKRFSFRVESCAICMPGKRHCMRAAMEPGISLQWIMISKKSVGIAVRVLA